MGNRYFLGRCEKRLVGTGSGTSYLVPRVASERPHRDAETVKPGAEISATQAQDGPRDVAQHSFQVIVAFHFFLS